MSRYLLHYPLRIRVGDAIDVSDLWIGVESELELDRDAWELEHGLLVVKADAMSDELLADLGVSTWRELPVGPRRALRGGRS